MDSEEDDNKLEILVSTINGKTRLVRLPPDSLVDPLFLKVAAMISDDMQPKDVRLVFAARHLEYGKGKTLKDYEIVNHSTVVPLFRLRGGIWPKDALKQRKADLVDLPGYITVTSLKSEPDMISLDDSTTERRAKMPCGHVIGPASMTSFCHSLLSTGLFTFNCPYVAGTGQICGQEWPYFLVRHVACLSESEMKEFEGKLTANYLNRASGIQQCPGCQNWCFREETNTNDMMCTICTKREGVKYRFCWCCLSLWNAKNNTCGNPTCSGADKRIELLQACPKKKIGEVETPSLRGCPKCGLLIEHKTACKHMACTCCKYAFCFACLEPKESSGKWPCSPYNRCTIAPVQTNLPGC